MGASKVQRSHRPQESGRFRFWCRHVDISSLTLSLGERRRFVRFIFGHDTTRESLARRSSLPSYRISLFIPSDSQVPKQQFPMPRYRAKLRPSAFLPASLVPFLSRPAMRPCPPPRYSPYLQVDRRLLLPFLSSSSYRYPASFMPLAGWFFRRKFGLARLIPSL